MDTKIILLIAHVFSAIIGAGGAFVSDGIFLTAIKDGRITRDELRFIHQGSTFVVAGLIGLILSGIGLVLMDPAFYFSSSKFLAKISIVGVIILNGIVLHSIHLPLFRKYAGHELAKEPEFIQKSSLILLSGVISVVSWASTVILGVMRTIPYEYEIIMAVYAALIIGGIMNGFLLKKKLLGIS
ncbi:MAG: hypothetical protein RIQ54_637 [Candidatus Parcubacteria bacterium]